MKAMIESGKKMLFADETCIGIFKINDAYQIHVLSHTLVALLEKKYTELELVHFRCFSETLLALGYKEILQQLSISSLRALIKRENPELEDLKMKYFCTKINS